MTEIKLKPCPFCDNEAILKENISKDEIRYYVMCGKCTSKSRMFVTKEDAVAAWNKRADNTIVIHGKWIRECFAYCRCSICNTEFDKDFLYFTYRHNWKRPVYCPNCGAKMDGGGESD